jgi:hypothetical protein
MHAIPTNLSFSPRHTRRQPSRADLASSVLHGNYKHSKNKQSLSWQVLWSRASQKKLTASQKLLIFAPLWSKVSYLTCVIHKSKTRNLNTIYGSRSRVSLYFLTAPQQVEKKEPLFFPENRLVSAMPGS